MLHRPVRSAVYAVMICVLIYLITRASLLDLAIVFVGEWVGLMSLWPPSTGPGADLRPGREVGPPALRWRGRRWSGRWP